MATVANLLHINYNTTSPLFFIRLTTTTKETKKNMNSQHFYINLYIYILWFKQKVPRAKLLPRINSHEYITKAKELGVSQ